MSLSATLLGVAMALAAGNAAAKEFVYVASQDQIVRAFAVDDATGALSAIQDGDGKADQSPIAITNSRDGHNVYTVNLTNSDISGFKVNGLTGALTEIPGSPFAFPRLQFPPIGMVVHPSGKFAYVNASLSQLWEYVVDPVTGAITATGNPARVGTSASLGIDPSGRFLYAANTFRSTPPLPEFQASSTSAFTPAPPPPPPRPVPVGADISAFAINQTTGALTEITGAPFPVVTGPKRLTMDPNGRFVLVANSEKQTITNYAINPTSGALTQVSPPIVADGGTLDIRFEPTDHYVYVTLPALKRVSVYAFNTPTGGGFGLHKVQDVNTTGTPTHLGVDPKGAFLFVMLTDTSTVVATYAIDATTGLLRQSSDPFTVDSGNGAVGMTVSNVLPIVTSCGSSCSSGQ
jgi:6-phosphogluconolactonase (cycloisomerase 2 family)